MRQRAIVVRIRHPQKPTRGFGGAKLLSAKFWISVASGALQSALDMEGGQRDRRAVAVPRCIDSRYFAYTLLPCLLVLS